MGCTDYMPRRAEDVQGLGLRGVLSNVKLQNERRKMETDKQNHLHNFLEIIHRIS